MARNRGMRRAAGIVLLLAAALVAVAFMVPEGDRAKPLIESKREPSRIDQLALTPVAKPDASQGGRVVASLAKTETKPFRLLGVTWDPGPTPDGFSIEVRWRNAGTWTAWTPVDLEADSSDVEGGRPATEPFWVDHADAVTVRASQTTGAAPAGLKLVVIDPGEGPSIAPAAVSQPNIITRAQWGAAPGTTCDDPVYGTTTRGAVVHHTVGSNTYAAADSASIVRGIQDFHVSGRGWCDIGYNFLVDKYGQTFEGRKGGIDKPVRGAHADNAEVNQETMGVSLMGEFTDVNPTEAMKTAVVNLIAWRFDQYRVPAKGQYAIGGLDLNRIAGHRDVKSTACPGDMVYLWLGASGGLRDRVAARLVPSRGVAVFRPGVGWYESFDLSGTVHRQFSYGVATDTPFVGDFNGDGRTDVGVWRAGEFLIEFDGDGNPVVKAFSFGYPTDRPVVGDFNGDGRTDIGVRRGNIWYLRYSLSNGVPDRVLTFGAPGDIPIVGDWDGDGRDTVGVLAGNTFKLTNTLSEGPASEVFTFGTAGLPVVGDWNMDGRDEVGRHDGAFRLASVNAPGATVRTVVFGQPGDIPFIGNWR